jgi:hypothetical protein
MRDRRSEVGRTMDVSPRGILVGTIVPLRFSHGKNRMLAMRE